jgi:hypothetical protein
MVPDARVFSSIKNEQKYPWLYDSVVHQGYLIKFCELFCGHPSSSQEFVTVGITLVQYDCYSITGPQTNKCIALPIVSQFTSFMR